MENGNLASRISNLSDSKRALLARRLRSRLGDGVSGRAEEIGRRLPGEAVPLSFSQRGVWFFQRLQPRSAIYNVSCDARIEGELDVAVLKASLEDVVARHDPLRAVFYVEDDEPHVKVLPSVALPLRECSLVAVEEEHREQRLRAELQSEAETPFDFERGPLFRLVLYRLGEATHILSVTMPIVIWS